MNRLSYCTTQNKIILNSETEGLIEQKAPNASTASVGPQIMTEYIDLNRRFIKAFNKDNPEGSALQSYLVADLMGFGASLGWGDVLESPISVILGEPGSGKTAEVRQQSDKLIANRERAFFIRLDRLSMNRSCQS